MAPPKRRPRSGWLARTAKNRLVGLIIQAKDRLYVLAAVLAVLVPHVEEFGRGWRNVFELEPNGIIKALVGD